MGPPIISMSATPPRASPELSPAHDAKAIDGRAEDLSDGGKGQIKTLRGRAVLFEKGWKAVVRGLAVGEPSRDLNEPTGGASFSGLSLAHHLGAEKKINA